MAYGLLPTGFSAKPLSAILAEIEAAEKALIDPTVDVSAESLLGQLNGILAAHLAELWELAETAYNARVPGNASFQTLDDLCAITGASRAKATKGTVTLSVQLGAGVTLGPGAVAAVAGSSTNRWVTLVDAHNPGGAPAWVDVAAQAQAAGYLPATAGTITEIATPSAGWLAVTHAADAVPGTDTELDAALRVRREAMLGAGGTAPVNALRADLLAIPGVKQCVVLENPTDVRDTNGLPPHSLEVLIDFVGAGVDQAIANALWAGKPAGIEVFNRTAMWGGGGTAKDVTGADGVVRTMYFTVPTLVGVHALATVEVVPERYAGGAALQAALAAVTVNQPMGAPLRLSDLVLAARAVPGVRDAVVEAGYVTDPVTPKNVTATPRQILHLAAGDVTVVVA